MRTEERAALAAARPRQRPVHQLLSEYDARPGLRLDPVHWHVRRPFSAAQLVGCPGLAPALVLGQRREVRPMRPWDAAEAALAGRHRLELIDQGQQPCAAERKVSCKRAIGVGKGSRQSGPL